jgi:hypothetical protein
VNTFLNGIRSGLLLGLLTALALWARWGNHYTEQSLHHTLEVAIRTHAAVRAQD